MVHNGHELTRNTTNCNKATTISDGSLVHSLSSFHKPFPKSASCQERSPIELPHLPHPSPPPCAPSTYFQGTHGRNPPLCAIPCPLVIIIIIVSFVRFNREPHIYPGAHLLPILYRYPEQPAVTVVSTPATPCENKTPSSRQLTQSSSTQPQRQSHPSPTRRLC